MPTVREVIEILNKYHKPEDVIAWDYWQKEDVQTYVKDMEETLSDEEINEVLDMMDLGCDGEYGLNYYLLEDCVNDILDRRIQWRRNDETT